MGFFSSFAKSFSSSSSSVEANHNKNSFAGTIHSTPSKVTKEDLELRKIKDIKEVMEVAIDDEFTEDIERMVKYNDKQYQTQQAQFRKVVLEKYEEEDGWFTCAHCGKRFKKSEVQADHVIPRTNGGSFSIDNGQVLCIKCNQIKNDSEERTDEDLERIYEEKRIGREKDVEFLKYVEETLSRR